MASPAADVLAESRDGLLSRLLSPRRLFWLVVAWMVLVVLLGLGTIAIYKISVDAQRARIAKVEALGGRLYSIPGNDTGWTPARLLGEAWEPPAVNALLVDSPAGPDFPVLLKEAGHFSGLEVIHLQGVPLTDDQLKSLANRRSLKFLAVSGSDITNAGLISLENCSKLEMLDLRVTRITDRAIESLAKIKSLTHVDLRHTHVTNTAAARLQQALPNARIFCYPAPSEKHFQVLKDIGRRGGLWQGALHDGAQEIVGVSIDPGGNWSSFDWSMLKFIDKLDSVSIEGEQAPTTALTTIADMRQVEWLYLNKVELEEVDVAQIGRMTTLKRLYLEECTFDWESLRHRLPHLAQLESLGLDGVHVDASLLTAVNSLPKLTRLTLDSCQVDNQALASAALPSQLEFLSMSDSNLNDEGLQSIARCRNLKFLDISNTKVSDASVDLILSLPKLQSAYLYDSAMSFAGRNQVEAALQARSKSQSGVVAR